jgi:hypothetical protein
MKNQPSRVNRLLTVFFAVLLAIQVLYLLIGLASIPRYYQRVTTQAIGVEKPVVYYGEVQISNETVSQMAVERGLSLAEYATYRIIINVVAALTPLAVAALLVWRAGWQWFAWFTAFIIVFLGESVLSEQMLVGQLISIELYGANSFYWFLALLYLFLFPNGRAVPRRAGWLVGGLVIYHLVIQIGTVAAYIAPDLALRLDLPNWGQGIFVLPVLLNFAAIMASQVYRYRHVSTAIERQQTKWFLIGFGMIVALIPVAVYVDATGRSGFVVDVIDRLIWMPLYFGLAIAILRYHLYDIDVIIRKTLVYAVLTLLLALVYFGTVIVLQTLFGSLTGEQSPVVIVISTLVIAALFGSLRGRVQAVIDRRFFRQKYDAEQVLARFAQTARDEVELEALTAEVARIVQETMRPDAVGVWLRPARSRQR